MLPTRVGLVFRLVIAASIGLTATASAQFDQLVWHYSSPSGSGAGFLAPGFMIVTGPDCDGCCFNSLNQFFTVAPFDMRVMVQVAFDNNDKLPVEGADAAAFVVDGVMTSITGGCTGCYAAFDVPAGKTFGLGAWSFDCNAGPGAVSFTNLQIEPTPASAVVTGDQSLEGFGTAITSAGDLNGDGTPDFAVSSPTWDGSGTDRGRVRVFGGSDLRELHVVEGLVPGEDFGRALAGGADLDGDGVPDIVVGAPNADGAAVDAGVVYAYSGADSQLLFTVPGQAAGDRFGTSVALVGDLDADGLADLVVGAPMSDAAAADGGQVRALSGLDGSVLLTWSGELPGIQLGRSVAGAGDVDGDGVGDVVVGVPRADTPLTNAGEARVFSGGTGALLWTLTSSDAAFPAELGRSVAGLGDVDGDGVPDLAAGAWRDSEPAVTPQAGSVSVFSGRDGSRLFKVLGSEYQELGVSLAAVGDVNGDSVPDFAAGGTHESIFPIEPGLVRIFSGVDGSTVLTQFGMQDNDLAGRGVAGLGDVDGDGRNEVLVGAPNVGTGIVSRLSLKSVWTNLGHALEGSVTPHLQAIGLLHTGLPLTVSLEGGLPAAPVVLVVGTSTVLAPFKGGVMVPAPSLLVGGLLPGAHGNLKLQTTWPGGIPAGFDLYLQVWMPDAGAPFGYSASNALWGQVP